MGPWLKSTRALRLVFIAFALVVAWIGFQLATHGHTGILRTLVAAKHFLSEASISRSQQQSSASAPAPAGPRHSVNLSWKPSTSAVVGYNVYRRGPWGVIKLNSKPVTETSYVDRSVLPGETYFYVIKAVSTKGTESTASNEIRADIPSK
jgi:fibronectin type 3 domain-containing protein